MCTQFFLWCFMIVVPHFYDPTAASFRSLSWFLIIFPFIFFLFVLFQFYYFLNIFFLISRLFASRIYSSTLVFKSLVSSGCHLIPSSNFLCYLRFNNLASRDEDEERRCRKVKITATRLNDGITLSCCLSYTDPCFSYFIGIITRQHFWVLQLI